MAVIGFSTSMLANTTDVTYTEPTFTADESKPFSDSKFMDSYVKSIELKNGEVTKTWEYSAPRTFWNVLESMTMDAKAGETISAHFVANSLGDYSTSTVKQDLRFTAVVLAIDWNGDGTFEYAQKIVGNVPPTHNVGGNMDVLDFNYDIKVPEDVQPGTARVRFNYTNAWLQNIAPQQSETIEQYTQRAINTCKEGIIYDFDINIVEPGLKVTWEQPENGTITVKNGNEVLESPATVEPGTKLTIVPAPASGRYELEALTANDTPITPNKGKYEVTINENTNIAATFSIAKYEINWTGPTNGTIKVVYADNETQEVTKGSKVELDTKLKVIAEPSTSDYVLSRVWYVYGYGDEYDITKEGDSYEFTVQETNNGIKTIYIHAEFEKVVKYRITWAGEETMQGNSLKVVFAGTETEVIDLETLVPEGTVLEIIPTTVPGYHLSALSYTISGLQNVPFTIGNEPYTFTVKDGTEDPKMGYIVIISADFTPDTYTLSTSVNPTEGGSVSVTTTDGATIEGSVTHGQTIVITASENDGYKLQSLDVKGATKVDSQENQYTVEDDVTVTATFVEDAPVETWSEITLITMSANKPGDADVSAVTYNGEWGIQNSGASNEYGEEFTKVHGPYIAAPQAGDYLAVKYDVPAKAKYKFSFLSKRSGGLTEGMKLCYGKSLDALTDASDVMDIPNAGGNAPGIETESQTIDLEAGEYYFVYYFTKATTKVRVADFRLYQLEGSAVEPTPEYTVTLNKPENGNLSVKYSNGEEEVTVSTEDATEPKTFNVAENTKLTVTVTPAESYQLATLSPDMTKVEDSENVYEYTVTGAVTIEATFTEIPEGAIEPTDAGIKYSTDEVTYLYQITDSRSAEAGKSDFYWTLGLHNDYKAIQVTTEVLSGEDANKQYFFFKEGSDALHFRIYTAEGQNIDYVDGLTGNGWNGGNIGSDVTTKYMQYETTTSGEFMLVSTKYSNEYGIIASNGDLLNTRGTGNDGFVNMSWVINTYSGNNTDDNGSRFKFIEVKKPTMHSVTVIKPENGNLSVTYNNGEKDVTVSTDTEAQTFEVEEGTKLTVTVTPAKGFMLESLSPDMTEVADNENVYEYTITGTVTIEATFKAIQYGKVSAETSEKGSIEIQLQKQMTSEWAAVDKEYLEAVEFDTELRAKVEAKTGYTVKSVMKNGTAIDKNTDGYYYFTVDAEEITISAEFEQEAQDGYLITITNPAEGGTIKVMNGETEVTNNSRVPENTTVTIIPEAAPGYTTQKVLANGKIVAPRLVDEKPVYEKSITEDTEFTVVFKVMEYEINWVDPKNGTLKLYNSNNPGQELVKGTKVPAGTKITVVPDANDNYIFTRTYYTLGGKEVEITEGEKGFEFTVTPDSENPNNTVFYVYAEFEPETYTLTTEVTPEEGGTVSVTVDGKPAGETVKYGDVITVTVTENPRYKHESTVVEGAEEIDGQAGKYTVKGAVTITVTFTEDTSSINSIENGTVYYNAAEEVLYTGNAVSVRVYDLSGRLVLNAENQATVSLAELAEGVYTAIIDGKIIKLNK